MPAIASLEDLKSAREDLMEAKDLNELKGMWGITNCDTIPQSLPRRSLSAGGRNPTQCPQSLKGRNSHSAIGVLKGAISDSVDLIFNLLVVRFTDHDVKGAFLFFLAYGHG